MIWSAFKLSLLVVSCATVSVYGQASQTARERTPAGEVLLTIGGEVERPLKLTAADLGKLPRRSVSAKNHSGKEASFEGVELSEVLKMAGVKFGEAWRGKSLSLFLVVDAADGYRAVFGLPELDHTFTDRVILLADRRDGKALSATEGPSRIVVPDEKREGRWVRQVKIITVRLAR